MANPKLRMGEINLGTDDGDGGRPLPPETPFRILLLGDFRGNTRSGQPALAQRKVIEVDRDNFPNVLAQLKPEVKVALGSGQSTTIRFQQLEDFEPEQLFKKVAAFASLLDLRKRLNNPATFNGAKDEISGWGRAADAAPNAPAAVPENLLDQILQQSEQKTENEMSAAFLLPGISEWDRFIKNIVAPHLIAAPDPKLKDYEKVVDESVGVRLRTILQDPNFQALEAIWRGLFLLTRNLETDAQLRLFILDVSREELGRDINEANDLSETGLYRHLVVNAQEKPWAVVAGHYTFGPSQQDFDLLANAAQIAGKVGVSFVAAAHRSLVGCPSLVDEPSPRGWQLDPAAGQLWQQLRQMPNADYLGLAMPRFLLRLPHGDASSTIESFRFEEMPDGRVHENYLWGNPAVLCALFLGQAFTQDRWDLRPGDVNQIDDLPVHIYEDDGERIAKPCAEIPLNEDALDALLSRGLIPLLCGRGQDSLRIVRFQAVSGETLAGRWEG